MPHSKLPEFAVPPRRPFSDDTLRVLRTGSQFEIAIAYAADGYAVFPCDDEKKPRNGGNGYLDATKEERQVVAWWKQCPTATIGLPMAPNGLVAIDIDPRNGGYETLAVLEAQLGPLPRRFRQRTQSGGEHLLFSSPGVALKGTAGKGIDIKSNGYIIVAPSQGARGPYEWLATEAIDPLPMPWLAYLTKTPEAGDFDSATPPAEAWTTNVPDRELTSAEAEQLRQRLRELGPRAAGNKTTYRAFALIFCNYGRSPEDGKPFLEQWNRSNGRPLDDRERSRQYRQILGKLDPADRGAALGAGPDSFGLFGSAGSDRRSGGALAAGKPTGTDVDNGKRLVARVRCRFIYVHDEKRWYIYFDGRWQPDLLDRITEEAKALGGELRREALMDASALEATGAPVPTPAADDTEATERSVKITKSDALRKRGNAAESRARIEAMKAMASSDPSISATSKDFDGKPMLLNVANGTVDLATGELRQHCAEDYFNQIAPWSFESSATCPTFERFFGELFPEPAEQDWLHRALGYCATGETSEQIFLLLYGTGSNGKSTLLNILSEVLGDGYAGVVDSNLFVTSTSEDVARRSKMRLRNLRAGIVNELPSGGRINESTLKQITGGDPIWGAALYQNPVEFRPTAKLLVATNHKPRVESQDFGLWRRMRLIPFTAQFKGEHMDKDLPDKLRREAPGIMAWLVRGAVRWKRQGLADTPPRFLQATEEYQVNEDQLAEWLAKVAEVDPNSTIPTAVLYGAYLRDYGARGWSKRRFYKELETRGYPQKRLGKDNISCVVGLRLRPPEPVQSDQPLSLHPAVFR